MKNRYALMGLMNLFAAHIAFEAPGEGTPAAPAAPEAPAAPAAPETPKAPEAPETPKAPEAPAAPETPKAPDTAPSDAEKAELLREVMDKKAKLKAAQDAIAAYEGVDPAKVKALLAAEKAAEVAAAEAKGDFERVKTMMAEEHKKEVERLQALIAANDAKTADKDALIDKLTIGNDFGTSSYIKDSLTLSPAKIRVMYGSHFEVQDGRTVGYDKPAGAPGRTMLVDASGNPVGFEDAMKRIVDADPDKKDILKANVMPGSSSQTKPETATAPKAAAGTGLYGASRIAASLNKTS
jgi:chemotaxis protein histidine kinase CheA